MARKTVFILGAGFSFDAGIPMQSELIENILNYNLPRDLSPCRTRIKKFIQDIFGLDEDAAHHLALEDIYTPLHQAISRNDYLKSYSPSQLEEVENNLNQLIAHVIDNGKMNFEDREEYVDTFVRTLVREKERAPTTDHFSIMSLNWDIVLDKRIFEIIKGAGIIDYGCHCVGVEERSGMIPPIVAKERGLYTVKLLKLHGSLNWVTCPQCHRLFVNKHQKEGIRALNGTAECRFCSDDVKMDAAILLPTFQKDLAKLHFQQIWNQAAIELSEATKIVFIGYSFPLADFDFRALITKHVAAEGVEVEVVLFSDHEYPQDEPEEGKRYKDYFGNKLQRVHYCGAADYIEAL